MRSEKVVQLLEDPEEILKLGNHNYKKVNPDRPDILRELPSLERKLRYLYEEWQVDEADAEHIYGEEKPESAGTMNWFGVVVWHVL